MGKLRQLSQELWPLIDVILFSYIELIFRGGVSCLPAALLFLLLFVFIICAILAMKSNLIIIKICKVPREDF